ncbi:MAG TPA: hypothetical protein VJI71_02360 [Candidatus Norongarragalinales archaeon]|nr:hypothetical protein [Candidatus Norongarragalinales archaeon]
MYDPYAFSMSLRSWAPGFKRLGAPTKIRDTYGPKEMREKKFAVTKTKDEIVEEHSLVMQRVYQRCVLSIAAFAVGAYLFFMTLATGSETYLMASMVAIAWASYKWWHGAAAYSNWQEFELRPLLVPVEDIREPAAIPHWLTGKEPSFTIKKEAKA